MKHTTFYDLTFTALSKRADEVNTDYTVDEIMANGDEREITVFLQHEQIGWGDGWKTVGKEVIGVALCDLDDPQAAIEILTRDQAVDMLGARFVEDMEDME